MDTPHNDPNQPQSPIGGPAHDPDPTAPTVEQSAGAAGDEPRRLTRSRTDRVLGGVCGGVARYFGIDPVIARIVAVGMVLLGGAGVLLYLAALLLVPSDPALGGIGTAPATSDRSRTLGIVVVVVLLLFTWPFLLGGGFLLAGILVPIAVLAVVGLVIWWFVSGASPEGEPREIAKQALFGIGALIACGAIFTGGFIAAAAGGGAVAAGLVIAAGLALVVGAFAGRVRWLVLPALSLAMGVGIVAAAGIDFDGGFGERDYRPASASDIRDRYELAGGELVVDLRGTDLPAGDTPLTLDVGMGEATVLVPEDVCVASRAEIGIGLIEVFDRENAGADVDWEDLPRAANGNSRVVLDAEVGMGHVQVLHDAPVRDDFGSDGRFNRSFDDRNGGANTGCEASTLSAVGR